MTQKQETVMIEYLDHAWAQVRIKVVRELNGKKTNQYVRGLRGIDNAHREAAELLLEPSVVTAEVQTRIVTKWEDDTPGD